MFWHFAIINNRLAEIYLEEIMGQLQCYGHCYVKQSEYKTKKEKRYIEEDIAKNKFTFYKGRYHRIGTDELIELTR